MGGIAELNIIEEQLQGDVEIETVSEEKVTEEEVSEAITIKGNVTDEAGLPLPGVNIIIEGTTIGTQSDFDGNYLIEAEANQVLNFSYVGFATQQITLSNVSNYINVNLVFSEEIMGGLAIVGLITTGDYEPYVPPPNAAEMDAQGKARKAAFKNEREFKQIQLARKKAARKLKRSQKK